MNNPQDDTIEQGLNEVVEQWAKAELRGDASLLDRMLGDDFIGIGPLGFMLTKEEWLQRHTSGDLRYNVLDLSEVKTRAYGDAAVVTARQTQKAEYKGQPVEGSFRITLVLVLQDGRWLVAGLQLSPIQQPPMQRPS
jgi:ketosteroid isomerase-like protein